MASAGFDPAVLRDAYDAVAPEYARNFGDDLENLPLDTELLRRLAAVAQGLPVLDSGSGAPQGGLVLDVGCGPAQGGGYLAARGIPVLGLDLSAGMLAAAVARHGRVGLRAACADMRRLPLRDRCCAGVTSFYALHHLPREDLALVLNEFRRVLRPGAGLLLATHEGTGEYVANDDLGIRGTLYAAPELERAIADAGFADVRVRRRDPLPHERQSGRLYVTATWADSAFRTGPQ
jgi:SAM-dependent methyltransferase